MFWVAPVNTWSSGLILEEFVNSSEIFFLGHCDMSHCQRHILSQILNRTWYGEVWLSLQSTSQQCYSQILTGQRPRSVAPERGEGKCARACIITGRMLVWKPLILPSRSEASGVWCELLALPRAPFYWLLKPVEWLWFPVWVQHKLWEMFYIPYVINMALGMLAKCIQPQCNESVL